LKDVFQCTMLLDYFSYACMDYRMALCSRWKEAIKKRPNASLASWLLHHEPVPQKIITYSGDSSRICLGSVLGVLSDEDPQSAHFRLWLLLRRPHSPVMHLASFYNIHF